MLLPEVLKYCGLEFDQKCSHVFLTQFNSFTDTFWGLGNSQDPAWAPSSTPISLSSSGQQGCFPKVKLGFPAFSIAKGSSYLEEQGPQNSSYPSRGSTILAFLRFSSFAALRINSKSCRAAGQALSQQFHLLSHCVPLPTTVDYACSLPHGNSSMMLPLQDPHVHQMGPAWATVYTHWAERRAWLCCSSHTRLRTSALVSYSVRRPLSTFLRGRPATYLPGRQE